MDLLETGIRRLGIYEAEKVERLRRYIAELELWNKKQNLVRASGRDLIIRHILDSLAGYPLLNGICASGTGEDGRPRKLADIGSGGGLPGIPLAIWMDGWMVVLIEKSEKKCGFLRNVRSLCGLSNCTVKCSEIEHIDGPFDLCVFRALGKFGEYMPKIARVTASGGHAGAYKGKRDTVSAEIAKLGPEWELCGTYPLAVPFLEEAERHLVVLLRTG